MNAVILSLFIAATGQLFAQMFVHLATVCCIIAANFDRQNRMIVKLFNSSRKSLLLSLYIKRSTRTLVHFLMGNLCYSQLFLAFLSLNCPLSAALFGCFFIGRLAPNVLMDGILLLAALGGFIGITVLHYSLSYFSNLIHGKGGRLCGMFVRNQHRIGDFRTRFKFSLHLVTVHTLNRYGITYGSFGLITAVTIGKVSFSKTQIGV